MSELPCHHPHVDDRALERMLSGFDASFMSDSKWVRLLNALTAGPDLVLECFAKLVWDEKPRSFDIPGASYGFDYYDHAVEALISGPSSGWHKYKEIEWIEFPLMAAVPVDIDNRKLGTRQVEQDLVAIRSRITSVGRFELRDESSGLRLYAYRRRDSAYSSR